jgi:plasmid stabilization system protein ParE
MQFAPEAETDFAAVIGYLAERNPLAASGFAGRIFKIVDRLAERPSSRCFVASHPQAPPILQTRGPPTAVAARRPVRGPRRC